MATRFWARVAAGVVQEIVQTNGVSLVNKFTPEVAAMFVECDGTVQPSYTYDGVTFTAPAAPVVIPPLTPAQMAQAVIDDTGNPQSAFIRGLVQLLAQRFSLTPAQIITAIKNAAT